MPELPEVETIVRGLRAQLIGLTIKSVDHVGAHLLKRDRRLKSLAGDTFVGFRRRGKYMIAALASGEKLLIHLRMSGRLLLVEKQTKRDKHQHLVLSLSSGSQKLVFSDVRKFGIVEFLREHRDDGYHQLGIEATDITAAFLARQFVRSKRSIKALLLDQSVLAGLGNIYVDESLHRAQIHPCRLAPTISREQTARLATAIRSVLKSAVNKMGTTFDSYSGINGNPGGFSRHLRVYNREGTACRRCRAKIIKIRVAGRGTHLCPHCQT